MAPADVGRRAGRLARGRRAPAPDPLAVVAGVLERPERLQLHIQPIVDLAGARVAGYEALSRFGEGAPGPEEVFGAAEASGLGPALDAVVLERAADLLTDLPDGVFLTVNASPSRWVEPEWRRLVTELGRRHGGLRGLVVELTEHTPFSDLGAVDEGLELLRRLGGKVALDDAGTGYSGLLQLSSLRPDIVKVDRALLSGLDADPVKSALVEMLGGYAGRLDAWLLAEGVETEAELSTLVRLQVPLVQGYAVGRPESGQQTLDSDLRLRLQEMRLRSVGSQQVGALLQDRPVLPVDGWQQVPGLDVVDAAVLVDALGCPVDLLVASPGGPQRCPITLRCHPGELVADVAARAMSRPRERRFDPVVAVGQRGQLLGVVLAEDVVLHLARHSSTRVN